MSNTSAEVARPRGLKEEALMRTQLHVQCERYGRQVGQEQGQTEQGKGRKAWGRGQRAEGIRQRGKGQRADLHDDAAQGALQSVAHNGCSLPPHALQPLHQQAPSPPHIFLPLIPPPCIPGPHPTALSILRSSNSKGRMKVCQGGSMVAVFYSTRQATLIIQSRLSCGQ